MGSETNFLKNCCTLSQRLKEKGNINVSLDACESTVQETAEKMV